MSAGELWMLDAECRHHLALGWVKDADQATRREIAAMTTVCARCAVLGHCREFVCREQITGGFWAGAFRDLADPDADDETGLGGVA